LRLILGRKILGSYSQCPSEKKMSILDETSVLEAIGILHKLLELLNLNRLL